MLVPSKIAQYKLDTEFCGDTITHTSRLQDGQPIRTPGTTWTREKKLGAGGFRTVWRERRALTGELRAVKILAKLQLNIREVEAMADLQDYPTYFITFLGWFEDMHSVYIAMEYLEHGDLTQYIKDDAVRARTEAKEITSQLLNGLVVLHERGICHRDIKPQNILIASISPIWVKITDFGISKQSMGTSLRTSCGTPAYQAPEQLGLLPKKFKTSAKGSYTKAVDLWSIGAVIHQILTTEIPFSETYEMDSEMEITTQSDMTSYEPTVDSGMIYEYCRSAEFPVEILEQSGVEPEAIDLIKRLMAPDPRGRISATDALESLWFPPRGAGLVAPDPRGPISVTNALRFPEQADLRSQFQMLGVDISPEDAESLLNGTRDVILNILHFREISEICKIQRAAVAMGYVDVLSVLFKVADIEATSEHHSLMQIAAGKGQLRTMKLLFDYGAKAYLTSSGQGNTPLHEAAAGGHLDAIRLLLDRGADIGAASTTQNGQLALHAAAAGGHLDAIQLLLDRGASVNLSATTQNGQLPLHGAAAGGHVDAIRLLLDQGAELNSAANTQAGQLPLHGAAAGGHVDAIKVLLSRGANLTLVAGTQNSQTALHGAAAGGHLDAIRLLLNRGADIRAAATTQNGQLALHGAAAGGHVDAIRLLLGRGADITSIANTQNGQSALHGATVGGHLDAMRLLLDKGAILNHPVPIVDAQTPLHAAAAAGNLEAITLLLDRGHNVNLAPYDPSPEFVGLRPLHLAAEGGHIDAVQLLLSRGAKVGNRPMPAHLDSSILAILKEHNQ